MMQTMISEQLHIEKFSRSAAETMQLGEVLSEQLSPGSIVALVGDLGSGKTTLVKGMVQKSTSLISREINSPTFTYLNIYPASLFSIYHFDLYRLETTEDFLDLGFEEFLHAGGICCIEWPEKIYPLLSSFSVVTVHFKHISPEERHIVITKRNI